MFDSDATSRHWSSSSESLTATSDHPFFVVRGEGLSERPAAKDEVPLAERLSVRGGRWVEAKHLKIGDVLRTRRGVSATVTGLILRTERLRVYNLQVLRLHNYAVGHAGLLVHNNANCPPKEIKGNPFRGDSAPQQAYDHLKKNHGVEPHVASNRLHKIKESAGLGAADDVVIGRTGDVYNPKTGDWIGSLTDKTLGTER